MKDAYLPDGISGIYLCGGYPENYLKELSENISMKEDIKKAYDLKMPIIAECGGFMYLHENVEDECGQNYPLVGVVKGVCKKAKKLQHFGYGTLKLNKNCFLGTTGEAFPIHSFHYYTSTSSEAHCLITKASDGSPWSECSVKDWLYGGFPHFFLQGENKMLNGFYTACKKWQEDNK
ncbi:Cobyrinate a,c-diamide synthase [bioreactor metagenome]|uniref:Cobyrinate a,c-diamide synthase n=1 Tax=bioreactor metagenome TaxID=1076179 RepID=A0A645C072_9ZZZZ